MKIKNIEIKNNLIYAPMAGYSDFAFRSLCVMCGADYGVSEMVSAKGLFYDNQNTMDLLRTADNEQIKVAQIFGNDPKIMAQMVKSKSLEKFDIIDINMGCPVKKVAIKSKAGSALLKNPEKVEDIVKNVVDTVPIPVTAKIRSGWDEDSINAIEIAQIIEDAGASAITVHPRTRNQKYDVHSDWSIIKEVKENVSIPVIGNGDIKSCYDAKRMIDETNCDAVMIGRGVLGNPWLIKQCIDYLDYGIEPEKITIEEKISMLKKHTEMLFESKPEKVAIAKMRLHSAYYLKNLPKSVEIKPKIFKTNSPEELFKIIDKYILDLSSNYQY